jgi:hypothetical protein
MNKKLQILKILTQATKLVSQHYKLLLKFTIPLIVFELLGVLMADKILYIFHRYNSSYNWLYYVFLVVSLYFLALAYIGYFRTFILGAQEANFLKVLRWGKRELKTITWMIVLTLIYILISSMPLLIYDLVDRGYGYLVIIVHLSFLFLAIYIPTRLSLIFAAISVDDSNLKVAKVWSLSKGNSIKLFLMVGLVPFLFLVNFLFGSLTGIGLYFSEFNGLWYILIKKLLFFLYLAYIGAIVSLCYQGLTSMEQNKD